MDDVHNTIAMRLSNVQRTNDKDTFPRKPDDLLAALRRHDSSFPNTQETVMSLTEFGLNNAVINNPVACAEVFALMLDNVYEALLGTDVDKALLLLGL